MNAFGVVRAELREPLVRPKRARVQAGTGRQRACGAAGEPAHRDWGRGTHIDSFVLFTFALVFFDVVAAMSRVKLSTCFSGEVSVRDDPRI